MWLGQSKSIKYQDEEVTSLGQVIDQNIFKIFHSKCPMVRIHYQIIVSCTDLEHKSNSTCSSVVSHYSP